jgi:hypothetical protein
MKDVLVLVNQPEQSDDEKELYRAQGACTLLNKMKNMKVEVQTKAKRG